MKKFVEMPLVEEKNDIDRIWEAIYQLQNEMNAVKAKLR